VSALATLGAYDPGVPANPAPPGARRQRRRGSRDWITLDAAGGRRAPALPRRSRPWLASTREWWARVWASPMAGAYLEADLGGLHRLAVLQEGIARGELPAAAHAAVTALEDRYGLSPASRQRLQWLVIDAQPRLVEQPRPPSSSVRRLRAVDPAGEERAD
jgi:hypothetical protein